MAGLSCVLNWNMPKLTNILLILAVSLLARVAFAEHHAWPESLENSIKPIVAAMRTSLTQAAEPETRWESRPELFSASLCTLVVHGDASGNPKVYRPGWGDFPSKNPLTRSSDERTMTFTARGCGRVEFKRSQSNFELGYEHSGKQIRHIGELYVATKAEFGDLDLRILKTGKGEYYLISYGGCGSNFKVNLDGKPACVVNMLPSLQPCPGMQSI